MVGDEDGVDVVGDGDRSALGGIVGSVLGSVVGSELGSLVGSNVRSNEYVMLI